MPTVEDATFGVIEFSAKSAVESRIDMAPYRALVQTILAQPPDEQEARFTVLTGEMYPAGHTNEGRGKLEIIDDRRIRQAASEIEGKSASIRVKHVEGGRTQFTVNIVAKRTYTDEQMHNREVGFAESQVNRNMKRLAELKAEITANPDDESLKEKAKAAQDRVTKYRKQLAELNGSSGDAPATKPAGTTKK